MKYVIWSVYFLIVILLTLIIYKILNRLFSKKNNTEKLKLHSENPSINKQKETKEFINGNNIQSELLQRKAATLIKTTLIYLLSFFLSTIIISITNYLICIKTMDCELNALTKWQEEVVANYKPIWNPNLLGSGYESQNFEESLETFVCNDFKHTFLREFGGNTLMIASEREPLYRFQYENRLYFIYYKANELLFTYLFLFSIIGYISIVSIKSFWYWLQKYSE